MIKVEKDSVAIPEILMPPTKDFFDKEPFPRKSRTTHDKRLAIIEKGCYEDDSNRYSHDDIKNTLLKLYDYRCAYCGQRHSKGTLHVEHYRPKGHYPPLNQKDLKGYQAHEGYYWLALSWDNLLLACTDCNLAKGSIFDIENEDYRAKYDENDHNGWNKINNLGKKYDDEEGPYLINPEKEDPITHFIFRRDGHVEGQTERGQKTITICNLDRENLVTERYSIIDNFEMEVYDLAITYRFDLANYLKSVASKIVSFKKITNKQKESFVAFRRQAIEQNWLMVIAFGKFVRTTGNQIQFETFRDDLNREMNNIMNNNDK